MITVTRYLNVDGMLTFENMIADYVKETNNHVMYRVTPIFEGNNLLASGVLMEGYSVEDRGEGIEFCVCAYNAQSGISINYTNENSFSLSGTPTQEQTSNQESSPTTSTTAQYISNTNTMNFHLPKCSSIKQIADGNKSEFSGNKNTIIKQGYSPREMSSVIINW